MPTIYVREKKYSGTIQNYIPIVQEIENDIGSVVSSAVIYELNNKIKSASKYKKAAFAMCLKNIKGHDRYIRNEKKKKNKC